MERTSKLVLAWHLGKRTVKATDAFIRKLVRIPLKWATDSGDVGQSRSEATLVVFLH